MCSGDAIGGRVEAAPSAFRRIERGHRLRASVLLIQPEMVAR
jgi:hypothetical protein